MMTVWTVIVNDEDYDGVFAYRMYSVPDRLPAWNAAVKAFGQERGQWPVAMLRGDFANTVVTDRNKEDWNKEEWGNE